MSDGLGEDGAGSSSSHKVERCEEDKIVADYGQAYDHPKHVDGYDDEPILQAHPFRSLTNWKLCRMTPSDSDSDGDCRAIATRRPACALPELAKFSSEHVLIGELEPTLETEEGRRFRGRRLSVVLKDLSYWVVDRSAIGRGIWVLSSHAWYRLLKPSATPVDGVKVCVLVDGKPTTPSSEGPTKALTPSSNKNGDDDEEEAVFDDDYANAKSKPSNRSPAHDAFVAILPPQETVHLATRAKFGLMSNIVDVMSESFDGKRCYYITTHAKRSPRSVHKLLTPPPDVWEKHNNNGEGGSLNRNPFDLQLLENCPGAAEFVHQHLNKFHSDLPSDSLFMKGLKTLGDTVPQHHDQSQPASFNGTWTDDRLCASALESERRGHRNEWGELLNKEQTSPVRPNRYIELQIQDQVRKAKELRAALDRSANRRDGTEHGSERVDRPTAIPKVEDRKEEDVSSHQPKEKGTKVEADSNVKSDGHENSSATQETVDQGRDTAHAQGETTRKISENVEDHNQNDRVSLIPDDDPDVAKFQLNVRTPAKKSFSRSAMSEALENLGKYLTPQPSSEDKEAAEYNKFAVREDTLSEFLEESILQGDVHSLESMLLVVESLRSSGKKVKRSLFKADARMPLLPGKVIFKVWLRYSLQRVVSRLSRSKGGEDDDDKKKERRRRPTTELLACSIMGLILDYRLFPNLSKIKILKTKYGVDWIGLVDGTLAIAKEHDVLKLIEAAEKAQEHLRTLPGDEHEKPAESAGAPTAPSSAPTASLKSDIKEEESARTATEAQRVASDALKTVAEKKRKQVEEEQKEEQKRLRILQILKKRKVSEANVGVKPEASVDISGRQGDRKDIQKDKLDQRTSSDGRRERDRTDCSEAGTLDSSRGNELETERNLPRSESKVPKEGSTEPGRFAAKSTESGWRRSGQQHGQSDGDSIAGAKRHARDEDGGHERGSNGENSGNGLSKKRRMESFEERPHSGDSRRGAPSDGETRRELPTFVDDDAGGKVKREESEDVPWRGREISEHGDGNAGGKKDHVSTDSSWGSLNKGGRATGWGSARPGGWGSGSSSGWGRSSSGGWGRRSADESQRSSAPTSDSESHREVRDSWVAGPSQSDSQGWSGRSPLSSENRSVSNVHIPDIPESGRRTSTSFCTGGRDRDSQQNDQVRNPDDRGTSFDGSKSRDASWNATNRPIGPEGRRGSWGDAGSSSSETRSLMTGYGRRPSWGAKSMSVDAQGPSLSGSNSSEGRDLARERGGQWTSRGANASAGDNERPDYRRSQVRVEGEQTYEDTSRKHHFKREEGSGYPDSRGRSSGDYARESRERWEADRVNNGPDRSDGQRHADHSMERDSSRRQHAWSDRKTDAMDEDRGYRHGAGHYDSSRSSGILSDSHRRQVHQQEKPVDRDVPSRRLSDSNKQHSRQESNRNDRRSPPAKREEDAVRGRRSYDRGESGPSKSVAPTSGATPFPMADKGLGRGRGRGRALTLPAWMTQGKGPGLDRSQEAEQTSRNEGLAARGSDGRPERADIGHIDDHRRSESAGRRDEQRRGSLEGDRRPGGSADARQQLHSDRAENSQNHFIPAPPGSRGRGRGRDVNRPAWMTRGLSK